MSMISSLEFVNIVPCMAKGLEAQILKNRDSLDYPDGLNLITWVFKNEEIPLVVV
jgi:hypothetical protein